MKAVVPGRARTVPPVLRQTIVRSGASASIPKLGLGEKSLEEMTRQVYYEDLMSRGYRVLDTKPAHFIIRAKHGCPTRDRQNRVVYALVDFELLQRTEEYETRFHIAQRSRYWRFHRYKDHKAKTLPEGLHYMKILGVDYIYGSPSNQGRLFVIGNDPDLENVRNIFHKEVTGKSMIDDVVVIQNVQNGCLDISDVPMFFGRDPIEKRGLSA